MLMNDKSVIKANNPTFDGRTTADSKKFLFYQVKITYQSLLYESQIDPISSLCINFVSFFHYCLLLTQNHVKCSKYWASEGFHVHYISSQAQETLPATLQGTNSDVQTYAQFMQITFSIAPEVRDLIDYLLSLQKSARLPKVLVVEDITGYATNSPPSDYLLMCSLLRNAINLCSQANDNSAFLIVSSKFIPDTLNKINLILMPTKIWRCREENDDYILREISLNPAVKVTNELHFSVRRMGEESVLRLNNIKSLFEENCSFNNSVM